MFRHNQFRSLLQIQSPLQKLRFFSSEAVKTTKSSFQEEWDGSKAYESIPTITKFQALRYFSPGGMSKNQKQ